MENISDIKVCNKVEIFYGPAKTYPYLCAYR